MINMNTYDMLLRKYKEFTLIGESIDAILEHNRYLGNEGGARQALENLNEAAEKHGLAPFYEDTNSLNEDCANFAYTLAKRVI